MKGKLFSGWFMRLVCSLCLYGLMLALEAIWHRTQGGILPETASAIVFSVLIVKTLIWVLPWLPLLRVREGWSVPLKESFGLPPMLPLVTGLCASVAALHTIRLVTGRGNVIVFFEVMFLVLSVCAGVVEELAFRGLLFNWQWKAVGLWPAVLLNGLLFALYHYPGLLFGESPAELFSPRGLLLFVMGGLFSLSFYKWKSLPLNMTVHTVWNILSYLFGLAG